MPIILLNLLLRTKSLGLLTFVKAIKRLTSIARVDRILYYDVLIKETLADREWVTFFYLPTR